MASALDGKEMDNGGQRRASALELKLRVESSSSTSSSTLDPNSELEGQTCLLILGSSPCAVSVSSGGYVANVQQCVVMSSKASRRGSDSGPTQEKDGRSV